MFKEPGLPPCEFTLFINCQPQILHYILRFFFFKSLTFNFYLHYFLPQILIFSKVGTSHCYASHKSVSSLWTLSEVNSQVKTNSVSRVVEIRCLGSDWQAASCHVCMICGQVQLLFNSAWRWRGKRSVTTIKVKVEKVYTVFEGGRGGGWV